MADSPWYAPGLSFACTQCGNCCTGAPGVVWVTEQEMRDLAAATGKTYGEILIHHTRLVGGRRTLTEFANGDCTFFDGATRKCTVYGARPEQCRTWPFWRSNIESQDAWNRVQEVCPGAGKGTFVPLSAIEEQAAGIDP